MNRPIYSFEAVAISQQNVKRTPTEKTILHITPHLAAVSGLLIVYENWLYHKTGDVDVVFRKVVQLAKSDEFPVPLEAGAITHD